VLLGWLYALGVWPVIQVLFSGRNPGQNPQLTEICVTFCAFFLTLCILPFLELSLPLCGLVGVFLAAALFSTLNSVSLGTSLPAFLNVSAWMATLVVCAGLGRKKEAILTFSRMVVLVGMALCAVGFLLVISGTGNSFAAGITSTFYQSDVFAGFLLLVIPVSFALALEQIEDRMRLWMYLLATLLFVVTLFLTGSRGAILVFVLLMFPGGYLVYKRRPQVLAWIPWGLGIAAAVTAVYLFRPKNHAFLARIIEKAKAPSNWMIASQARMTFWKGALANFVSHPWLGSGLETFGRVFPRFQQHFYWYSKYPHNFYLQTLSDGGLFVFIPLLALLGFIFYAGIRVLKKDVSVLTLGLFFAFLGGSLHLFLDVESNFLMWSLLFWGIGGFLISLDEGAHFRPPAVWMRITSTLIVLVLLGFQSAYAFSFYFDEKAHEAVRGNDPQAGVNLESKAIQFFSANGGYYEGKAQAEIFLCAAAKNRAWCDSAKADYEEALRRDPVRPLYLGELATLLNGTYGDRQNAERLWRRSIELDPFNYPYHYLALGDLKLAEGNLSAAGEFYERVIAIYPEPDLLRLPSFRQDEFRNAILFARARLAKIEKMRKGKVL